MDLKSGYPFWAVRNGLMTAFPRLQKDTRCDVLIIGAGITGALVAHAMTQAGMSVCVVDRRDVAWGSTSASTALLQYEIDTEMQDLATRYGLADAVLAYRACAAAIGKLHRLAGSLGGIDFQLMKSLYYASHWYHRQQLLDEGDLRRSQGLKVQTLDRKALKQAYGIDAATALLSEVGAQMDPYQMVHKLLRKVKRAGGQVFDHTAIECFKTQRGGVRATTGQGCRIDAKYLVLAAGYQNEQHLDQKVANNRSSYAYITDTIPGPLGGLDDTMVWESARPYIYLRRTGDNRVLIGGEDDEIDIPLKRDALVNRKAGTLHKKARKLFPELDLTPAFAWAGTFAETDDGLPFFGAHEQHGPRVLLAMAYGGNGITYSQIGSEILLAAVQGKSHPCAKLFSFARLARL
ncbi:MAG: FAD-dependent oxidoreductase [Pseudomonadota bacterium]